MSGVLKQNTVATKTDTHATHKHTQKNMHKAGWILVKHFIVLIKSNPLFPVFCANIAPSSGRSEGPESLFGVSVWLTVQFKLFWLEGGKAHLACERMETKAVKKENSARRALIRPKWQIKWRFTGKKIWVHLNQRITSRLLCIWLKGYSELKEKYKFNHIKTQFVYRFSLEFSGWLPTPIRQPS